MLPGPVGSGAAYEEAAVKPPAVLWRCEAPDGPPDLVELTRTIRVYLSRPAPTPLEEALAPRQETT